jgi:hypothetical protein
MQFVRVEIDASLDIANKGIVSPAIPQPGDDIVELTRAGIARGMLQMLVAAEIMRGFGVASGNDVPAGAALAEVIERGEAPGECCRACCRARLTGSPRRLLRRALSDRQG